MSRAAIHLGTLDFISGHNVRDERLSGSHVQPKTMSLDLSFLSISSILLKKWDVPKHNASVRGRAVNPNSNKHHWTRGHKTVPDAKREATHAGLSSQRLQRWCQMQFPTPPKKTFRVVPGVIWRIPQRLRFKLEQTRLILTFDGQRAADLSINASRPVRRHTRAVCTARARPGI